MSLTVCLEKPADCVETAVLDYGVWTVHSRWTLLLLLSKCSFEPESKCSYPLLFVLSRFCASSPLCFSTVHVFTYLKKKKKEFRLFDIQIPATLSAGIVRSFDTF